MKRLQDLDKITVDYVTLGEMQPERDHNFRGEGIGNGVSHRKSGERPGLVVGLNLI